MSTTKTSRTKERYQQPHGTARASSKHALSAVPTLAAAPAAATARGAAPAARSASAAAAAAAALSSPKDSKSTPECPGQWVNQVATECPVCGKRLATMGCPAAGSTLGAAASAAALFCQLPQSQRRSMRLEAGCVQGQYDWCAT